MERTKSNGVAQSHRKKSHAMQKYKDKNKVKTNRDVGCSKNSFSV